MLESIKDLLLASTSTMTNFVPTLTGSGMGFAIGFIKG
jgi:hypothetical protein